MAVSKPNYLMPIISKMYCSSSQVVLVVRRRPQVVGGGGFVVMNCSQRVVFQVDGCGILGKKGELILRDSDGDAILLIRQLKVCVLIPNIYAIHLCIVIGTLCCSFTSNVMCIRIF